MSHLIFIHLYPNNNTRTTVRHTMGATYCFRNQCQNFKSPKLLYPSCSSLGYRRALPCHLLAISLVFQHKCGCVCLCRVGGLLEAVFPSVLWMVSRGTAWHFDTSQICSKTFLIQLSTHTHEHTHTHNFRMFQNVATLLFSLEF